MFLYNMDFAMEWPRPLPPNVQLVGALLPTQAKPLPPQFEVGMQHHLTSLADALQLAGRNCMHANRWGALQRVAFRKDAVHMPGTSRQCAQASLDE